MESDDSNGGSSSATNSTSNSSSNSRASTPGAVNEHDEGPKSPPPSPVDNLEQLAELSQSSVGKNSNLSDTSSSSSSSDGEAEDEDENDNEAAKSNGSDDNEEQQQAKSKESTPSSSSAGSPEKPQSPASAAPQSPQSPQSPASAAPQSPQSPASRTSRTPSRNQSPISAENSGNQSPISAENTRALSRHNSISHEDLSDVSDMDIDRNSPNCEILENSMLSAKDGEEATNEELPTDCSRHLSLEENNSNDAVITDLRQRLDQKKNQTKVSESNGLNNGEEHVTKNGNKNDESFEELVKTHDDEDALDFEAEEGECPELNKDEEKAKKAEDNADKHNKHDKKKNNDLEEGEELEEGEVSDEDEKRPEEIEPKPVCRFYTRGQCTWGMSCRFLHPGVTDKGNYTMFDMMPPVAVPQGGAPRRDPYGMHVTPDYRDYRTDRPAMLHRAILPHSTVLPPAAPYSPHPVEARALISETPVVVESAWERGLRTAKEMLCKAKKRKEQDMDFEDKKMNLTLSPDELEKDPYYLKDRSPIDERVSATSYGRHPSNMYPDGHERAIYSPQERYNRAPPIPSYDDVDPYSRSAARYRELPPHRMPHYEDDRRVRPTREVIVQRVDPPMARGDEWNDPWMRSKSPLVRGGSRERADKRRRDRRSYSSQSSYSSSSSSQSESSSGSSRSPSPAPHRRRYNSGSHKSPQPPPPLPPSSSRGKHVVRGARSPSPPPVRRSRRSPIAIKKEERKNEAWEAKHFQKPGVPLLPKRRGHMSLSPQLDIRRGPMSPEQKRKKMSPGKKLSAGNVKIKGKRHRTSSSSPSGTSDSSASDSDSSSSSSTASSSRSRERSIAAKRGMRFPEKAPRLDKHHPPIKKPEGTKKRSPISIELKRPNTVGTSALMSPPSSSSHGGVPHESEQKKTRREELLKQLRAVEDAIAKKRSKLS